jgi:uncharacterized protein
MERYQKVAAHKKLQYYMEKTAEAEKERIFCRHDWDHLIAVARIAYIIALEEHMDVSKDIIYATAFLHDIGKEAQYLRGIPHEIESALLAEGILEDCGYTKEEIALITDAILHHRTYQEENTDFQKLFYRADKLSRPCKGCAAADQCKWPEEKKNLGVSI